MLGSRTKRHGLFLPDNGFLCFVTKLYKQMPNTSVSSSEKMKQPKQRSERTFLKIYERTSARRWARQIHDREMIHGFFL